MGKAGRWLKSFLSGKKDSRPPQAEATPVLALPQPTPKEKRWSFRRPVPAGKSASETPATAGRGGVSTDVDLEQKKHAVATSAAATVPRLSARQASQSASLVEDAAAVTIQATFRGYLARTALRALRGIVKLQALVRGQLVRTQANATLRRMQALLAAQTQLRAQRMRVLQQEQRHQQPPRQSPQHPRHRRSNETDRSCEDNAKVVEVDIGEPVRRGAAKDRECFVDYQHGRCSPAVTEMSPRAYSGHFDEFSLATARSSPQHEAASELCCPSYMANTESSRAKARSQSAPRQRADALERLPSRRKGTPPRSSSAAKMQRSSSLVGAPAPRSPAPWWSAAAGVRLDVSNASVKDSECGSTSSVLTAATVYSRTRSLVGFEVRRGMY